MLGLGFGNKSDFDLKSSFGPLLVWFSVEIWSDESLILRFLGLIFCLAALDWLGNVETWYLRFLVSLNKLDRVGPVDTRPSTN